VNLPLETTNIDEAAPLGDAILAATGAGIYKYPTDPIRDLVKTTSTIEPDPKTHDMYEDFFQIWRRIYFNLLKEFDDHHDLLFKYHFK
jgi:xylulokinase